ncbi:MAG: hypothetical protein KL863_06920 [Rhizobium sp.]|nr:hypothetical protein [Rhizobium sp.]
MEKHVIVAGSLHHDLVVNAERFPVADEYVLGHSPRTIPGGKGTNQALASARCGATTWLTGCVGDDEAGRNIAAHLSEAGVNVSLLQSAVDAATGSSVAIVNGFGDFGAVVMAGANAAFDASNVKLPPESGLLLLQNELSEAANITLARKARDAAVDVVVNGCPFREPDPELLSLAGTLILGLHEAEAMVGHAFSNARMALDAAQSLSERVPRIVVLLSAGGMVHAEPGGRPEYHPTRETKPQSMHGVLDFFVGAFASQIVGGSEFDAAAHYAQSAALLFMTTPVERRDLIRATQIRARLGEDDR